MDKSTVFNSHYATRPTIMVKRLGSRRYFFVKLKIDFLNNLIIASVMVRNNVFSYQWNIILLAIK